MIPRSPHYPQATDELTSLLASEDLALIGVAAVPRAGAAAEEAAQARYDQWLAGGLHGVMNYLERHADMKYHPERILSGCKSVIVVGMNYYQDRPKDAAGEPGPTEHATHRRARGRIARYAWGRDYHNALGKRLRRIAGKLRGAYPGGQFRPFVDASPLSERYFAERAGIGFTAKNTLTISSAYGSWFFLGEILSTIAFPTTGAPQSVHGACPRGCFRCGDLCPTGALTSPGTIDARRCISYLTIEHRGAIPEELRPLMGDRIFGCDDCQEVCPLNVRAQVTGITDFRVHRSGASIPLEEVLAIQDELGYRERFSGTPLLRPGRAAMIRNASIAAANAGAVELLPALRALASDPDPVIREHARWSVRQLESL